MGKDTFIRWSNRPKGAVGIVFEMCELRSRRKDIPCSWFRRACKRNGVSRTDLKAFLRAHFGIDYVFPIRNPFEKLEWDSYVNWLGKNMQVAKGETSYARELFTDIAMFNNYQVVGLKRSLLLTLVHYLEHKNE